MIFEGKSVCPGIAIGRILEFKDYDVENIEKKIISNCEEEIERYKKANEKSREQLKMLYDKTLKNIGEKSADIIEVHQMMLEDLDYNDYIINEINNEKVNAEYAVSRASNFFAETFSAMDDDYMKARSLDIKDISKRVIKNLLGVEDDVEFNEPKIILANDLTPSETVKFDKNMLLAFVTKLGSSNSHTAILARTMNIPALITCDYDEKLNGKFAIVDGYSGQLIIEPDDEVLDKYKKLHEHELEKAQLLEKLKGLETVTKDGRKIKLYANIGKVSDADIALENDAEGIGLFRSEFLYIGADRLPTEEEQFIAYKTVAEKMNGKNVVIRTLDIGADKEAKYLNLAKETNPALGYRAIRICLTQPEIFKTQLRALYRASVYGNISIMFPMIISVEEVKKIKEIVNEVKAELTNENVEFKDCELGVMIETPAAVMISEELAKEVSFFSVGTNDLSQYTLAIDRQNSMLDKFYNPHHEAIMRMLKMIVDNGHKHGCWVGICGELGTDTTLTEKFIDMGFDELSVSVSKVLEVKDAVRRI